MRAGQAIVIQTAFADGDGFGMACKFAEFRADISGRFVGVARMPADGGVDHRMLFGERERVTAAVQIRPDGDDFGDAGGLRTGEHVSEIRFVIVVIKVRVRVVKNRHGAGMMEKQRCEVHAGLLALLMKSNDGSLSLC